MSLKDYKWEIVGFCIALLSVVLLTQFYPHISDDCGKELSQTGFLSGWAEYPTHLNFHGDCWYVSDWWTANNYNPGDLSQYFNHTVKIDYFSGCGRCLVEKISVVEG